MDVRGQNFRILVKISLLAIFKGNYRQNWRPISGRLCQKLGTEQGVARIWDSRSGCKDVLRITQPQAQVYLAIAQFKTLYAQV
jgi:hypothetical protein